MAEALDPAAYIYQGIWTDWSKNNNVWGLTLTLSPDNAVLLTSFLAVFVTLSGSQMWCIVRFSLHQLGARAQTQPSTPRHKKEQVILRNANTDLATARMMSDLAWRSRRRAGKPRKRTILIAIVAALHAILFMVAGTFSNLAISVNSTMTGSRVLSRSKHCGVWNSTYYEIVGFGNNPSDEATFALSTEYQAKRVLNGQLSLEYASKCYPANDSYDYMSSICNTMQKPKLDWTVTTNHSCPFSPEICHDASKIVQMDTGDIDSHDDLGVNAKPDDRLKYRRITQCTVLNDTQHILGWNGAIQGSSQGASPNQTSDTAHAFYGPSLYKNTDWTYSYSNFAQFFDNFSVQVTVPYQVDAEIVYAASDPVWSSSDFDPIKELAQDSADLTLFFLSYSGTYTTEINDPWFSAHRGQTFEGSPPLLEGRFGRDSAISTVACTEQHRFCTHKGVCTPFGGFDQVQNVDSFNKALSSHQNATFDRLLRAATAGSMKEVVNALTITSTPLLAVKQMAAASTVVSLSLPQNQWELELAYWHSIAMAQLQRTVVQWATGQIAAQTEYLLPPAIEQDQWYCQNLLIQSTVFQSFSIMKLILILIFGTLVIVVSLNTESLARLIRKGLRKPAAQKDWDQDDMLKLRNDMRESLWKPAPPPKDAEYKKTSLPSTPSVPKIRTIRPVSHSSIESEEMWERSSSPTLPLEDRAISVTKSATPQPDGRYLSPPGPVYRQDRDSWMAISLNSFEATIPTIPSQVTQNEIGRPVLTIQEVPSTPMLQRLRNPMQFHLPRPPGGWV